MFRLRFRTLLQVRIRICLALILLLSLLYFFSIFMIILRFLILLTWVLLILRLNWPFIFILFMKILRGNNWSWCTFLLLREGLRMDVCWYFRFLSLLFIRLLIVYILPISFLFFFSILLFLYFCILRWILGFRFPDRLVSCTNYLFRLKVYRHLSSMTFILYLICFTINMSFLFLKRIGRNYSRSNWLILACWFVLSILQIRRRQYWLRLFMILTLCLRILDLSMMLKIIRNGSHLIILLLRGIFEFLRQINWCFGGNFRFWLRIL